MKNIERLLWLTLGIIYTGVVVLAFADGSSVEYPESISTGTALYRSRYVLHRPPIDYTADGWSAGLAITTIILEKGTVIQIRDDGEPTTTGQVLFSILMPDGSTAFEIVVPPPVDPTLEECPYRTPAEMPYMPVEYPRWHGEECTHGLYDPPGDFVTTGSVQFIWMFDTTSTTQMGADGLYSIDNSGDLKIRGE